MNLKQWIEEDSRVLTELESLLFKANVRIGSLHELRAFVDNCNESKNRIKLKEES